MSWTNYSIIQYNISNWCKLSCLQYFPQHLPSMNLSSDISRMTVSWHRISVWQVTRSVHWDTCSPWELCGTFVLKHWPAHWKLVSRIHSYLLNARNTTSGKCSYGYSDPLIRGLWLSLRDTVVTRVENDESQPAWDSLQPAGWELLSYWMRF